MDTEIKFCGLTRRDDANHAAALGAAYVGVIFAGGPRVLTPDRARDVLDDIPDSVQRVGVFANQSDDEIERAVDIVDLDVVQLHSEWDPQRVRRLVQRLDREVWPVVRVEGTNLPDWIAEAFRIGDAVLLDAYVAGALGGTGVALPWAQLSARLSSLRDSARLVLAGGLKPENVAIAIAALSPDVVDVSSGVESAPGIKDHDRMRAFRDAVTHASVST
ncbi:MAG TPA: phosphoribosylanthranilate isomerase [Gemmatimonadaceae bacterium]